MNLHGFLVNDAVNSWDYLGQYEQEEESCADLSPEAQELIRKLLDSLGTLHDGLTEQQERDIRRRILERLRELAEYETKGIDERRALEEARRWFDEMSDFIEPTEKIKKNPVIRVPGRPSAKLPASKLANLGRLLRSSVKPGAVGGLALDAVFNLDGVAKTTLVAVMLKYKGECEKCLGATEELNIFKARKGECKEVCDRHERAVKKIQEMFPDG